METKRWKVDKSVENLAGHPAIREAARLLQQNELVAFPTETVYGLGANACDDGAVGKIYAAKGRPSDNPLIIHISSLSELEKYVEKVPANAEKLMKTFWPGPLTVVFQKRKGVLSEAATAGLPTVAVRMPDHPVALALIRASGLPIAAPSANRSGKPSPTKAEHVLMDLEGKIAGIVDGGETGVGVESTVIDCTLDLPAILRPGGISKEKIEEVIGPVRSGSNFSPEGEKAPRSPGMKYTHYAPRAPLYLVEGSKEYIQGLIKKERSLGKRVGVLTTEERSGFYEADAAALCGRRADLATVARRLYDCLRYFDEEGVDVIFAETFEEEGIGAAVMNRLFKAAGGKVIREG
ncbi:MAG: threonylcarbamoyl-AMP synthase [Caldibacillus debilis]|jgi:L-threonylcarbamoyladenylate synthase|uniref:Threonylcarbamoyl-AMP synthase n=3 Tax=Caldibacillus debilis TaxID=301148 RepID=A0A420VGW1_9BACI|nr:L-threonylcarbamoyladenylate synthase [Caldibacillus debilis]MBO2481729.1 threonylcarbamoyl-AMP synthase [Bacillaceae bacterium]OUM84063.1 MAG: threonylcarbamoyl-AMP synthase [Caldibacillus debilis]REJ15470.1 MAG: threonylcarbamoyl-AMP synthase [Caldibacillus debilis]REJ29044.1 MAG: threonylcarbamoyl-AMP synthase [Caldibacillus debilis]REJ30934.1 MAG: threonylcarbamoyl-AMP synthase [Caldibacillus debilis]